MKRAAKWLDRFEIALIVTCVSSLGAGFAAAALRWNGETRQECAMFQSAGVADRPQGIVASDPSLTPGAPEPIGIQRAADLVPGSSGGDPLVLGKIEFPRIGVKAIVREGTDDATLFLAVGHVPGTARPGENGNAVLAGHRDTIFRELHNIRLNDTVRFVVPPLSYEYRVVSTVSTQVVAPDELSVLDAGEGEELTLVTCHPFHYLGRAPSRLIVHAARVK